MTSALPFKLTDDRPPQIGLIVLSEDETVEMDFRRLVPQEFELFVSRVPSGAEVLPETLSAMEAHIGTAAALFPRSSRFAAVGYACTSGAAQIGSSQVATLISSAVETRAVTNPLTALVSACHASGVRRLGMLSPYVAEVSRRIQDVLSEEGISTTAFGSFEVSEEARVARISGASLLAAAKAVADMGDVDALFLSCTNLRTLDVLPELEEAIGLPVFSSNQVLAWDLLRAAESGFVSA